MVLLAHCSLRRRLDSAAIPQGSSPSQPYLPPTTSQQAPSLQRDRPPCGLGHADSRLVCSESCVPAGATCALPPAPPRPSGPSPGPWQPTPAASLRHLRHQTCASFSEARKGLSERGSGRGEKEFPGARPEFPEHLPSAKESARGPAEPVSRGAAGLGGQRPSPPRAALHGARGRAPSSRTTDRPEPTTPSWHLGPGLHVLGRATSCLTVGPPRAEA